jgi:hypothetical protein
VTIGLNTAFDRVLRLTRLGNIAELPETRETALSASSRMYAHGAAGCVANRVGVVAKRA